MECCTSTVLYCTVFLAVFLQVDANINAAWVSYLSNPFPQQLAGQPYHALLSGSLTNTRLVHPLQLCSLLDPFFHIHKPCGVIDVHIDPRIIISFQGISSVLTTSTPRNRLQGCWS